MLLAIPVTSREQVRIALQTFILDHKTFKITPDQFIECVSQVPTIQSAPHKSKPLETEPALRKGRSLEIPNVEVKLQPRRESITESEMHDPPRTPIPRDLRKRIRTLSQERQFIPYDSSLSISILKPSQNHSKPARMSVRERIHRRTASSFVSENQPQDARPYSVIHNRKSPSIRPLDAEEPTSPCASRKSKAKHSPDSHIRTSDTSFVGSSATTPKRSIGPFAHAVSKPDGKVAIPSLKADIEKLLEVRQRYLEMSQKDEAV